MARIKNAIMKHSGNRTVTTNAGYTVTFEPGVETYVPALAVAEARRHGAVVVRLVGHDSVDIPESADPVKIPRLVDSVASTPSELDVNEFDDEVVEQVASTSDEDSDAAVAQAVKDIDSFTQKEARIKNAILKVISKNDSNDFVESTGRPKVSALSTALGGEPLNAETRDLVWAKMESQGLFKEGDDV